MRHSARWMCGFVLAAGLVCSAVSAADITGTYLCRGTADTGGIYQGSVAIGKLGDVYLLEWTIGNLKYKGTGILENDVLAVGWAVPRTSNSGIIAYRVQQDGTLLGRWTAIGGTRLQEEILTPMK